MGYPSTATEQAPNFLGSQIDRTREITSRLQSLRERLQQHVDLLGVPPAPVEPAFPGLAGGTPTRPTLVDANYELSRTADQLFEQINRLHTN